MYLIVILVLWLTPGSVIIASGQLQMTNVKVLERGDDWQCPTVNERETARNEIHDTINSVIVAIVADHNHTCNGTPGWRRIAFINMTDTNYNCPTGLRLTSYSKRTCGRSHTTEGGCSSTIFDVRGLPYSQVCGRIRGYQFGLTGAFHPYTEGIDSYYVQGISLTHRGAGNRRQHIWTFGAGLTEVNVSSFSDYECPCDTSHYDRVPTFVGDDYFCESGVNTAWSYQWVLYPDDVLWDGQDCTSTSTCCQLNNPP